MSLYWRVSVLVQGVLSVTASDRFNIMEYSLIAVDEVFLFFNKCS